VRSLSLELRFPNLRPETYTVTSRETTDYNCMAWVLGVTDEWWWPEVGSYWPTEPRELSLAAFVAALGRLGYETCEAREPEPGFEKVAVYVDSDDVPTHLARQLASGEWSSKCGRLEDLTHQLEVLEGPPLAYGTVARILRRPKTL
jgi:hypothetical protein